MLTTRLRPFFMRGIGIFFYLVLGIGLTAGTGLAAETVTTVAPAVSGELYALLATTGKSPSPEFSAGRAAHLVNFVLSKKPAGRMYRAGDGLDSESAYFEVDLDVSLARILKLAYNPRIPGALTTPASQRLAYWKRVTNGKECFDTLWKCLDHLQTPTVVTGIEHVENTPDTFSGAYYAFDLERSLILFRTGRAQVMISLATQPERSQVGSKGLIIGSDRDWNYLYSGQTGLNRPGLGWMHSYLYSSASALIYIQPDPDVPLVRCGIFKWVNAGWGFINVVRSRNIHDGLKRFAESFRFVIENPRLPSVKTIEEIYADMTQSSTSTLQAGMRAYLDHLEQRYGDRRGFPREWFEQWFKSDRYLKLLSRKDMIAALFLERLKGILRPQTGVSVATSTNGISG